MKKYIQNMPRDQSAERAKGIHISDKDSLKEGLIAYEFLKGPKGSVSDKFSQSVENMKTSKEMTKENFYNEIMIKEFGFDNREFLGHGTYNNVNLLTSSTNKSKRAILRYPREWSRDYRAKPASIAEVYITDNISRKNLTPKLYAAYLVSFKDQYYVMSIGEYAIYPDVFGDYLLDKVLYLKDKKRIQSALNIFARKVRDNIKGIAKLGYLPYDVKFENYVVMSGDNPRMIDFDSAFMRVKVENPIHVEISCMFMLLCSTQSLLNRALTQKNPDWDIGIQIIKTLQIFIFNEFIISLEKAMGKETLENLIQGIFETDGYYLEDYMDVKFIHDHYCASDVDYKINNKKGLDGKAVYNTKKIIKTYVGGFLITVVSVFYEIQNKYFLEELDHWLDDYVYYIDILKHILTTEIFNYDFRFDLAKFTYTPPISSSTYTTTASVPMSVTL